MTSKNTLLKKYKQKISEIKKHNNLYFNHDNPKISDKEYDDLKREIIILENKHLFLKKLKSIIINSFISSKIL